MRNLADILKATGLGLALLALCACQHDIDPEDLDFPPETEQSGIATSDVSPEEAEKVLEEIEAEPYPAYTIQGGDRFRVRVYNEDELNASTSSATTLVTPDGYLIMDMIEPVLVKDLTIVEATQKVKEELGKFIRYPHVAILPDAIQGKTATLLGAVRDPGEFAVTANTRLSDLIAKAKGFEMGYLDSKSVSLADIDNAYIVRDGKFIPVNFQEALMRGNQKHNIRIFPRDIVYVPKKEDSSVMVMGEVKQPRMVNWSSGMTFIDVLAYANGLTDEYWGSALILRKPKDPSDGALKVYKIDVDDVIAGRQRDFKLAAGDIVYIPKDSISEYNVFIRKLMPTAQLINALMSPPAYWLNN